MRSGRPASPARCGCFATGGCRRRCPAAIPTDGPSARWSLTVCEARRARALCGAAALAALAGSTAARADAPADNRATATAAATATSPGATARLPTPRRLGRLEQESLTDALTELGLRIEPAPE